jgi:DNA polymerase-3 subunit delta'
MKDIEDPRETNHPRLTRRLLGHEGAEQRLLSAWASGRMHHAWLLAGPRGIGKATLAYRFARFLFTHPDPAAGDSPQSMEVAPDAPAAALVAARSHPDLLVIERTINEKTERLRSQVRVEDARKASHFFSLSPAMGGWRVCIVDAADDLNSESANSLLKVLEEPPSRSMFLIVAHAPGRLLATIRSRSIRLDLKPLATGDVVEAMQALGAGEKSAPDELAAIAALSQGSPGRAMNLVGSKGAKLFLKFQQVAGKKPPFARGPLLEIAGHMKRLDAADDFPVFSDLMSDWVATTARARAVAGGAVAAQPWARAHQDIGHTIRRANALNLDRRQVLLEAFSSIEEAARLGHS